MTDWLDIYRGDAPLVIGLPHTGTGIPDGMEAHFVSPWLARKDADWWVDRLYGFAVEMGATIVRTRISRSVIDVNRDPAGRSLYPGQATTALCPTTTFDGEPLYRDEVPDAGEIARRRKRWFDPYHAALSAELDRLRAAHGKVVLYDAHSIVSHVPRLFDGELPQFNIGTDGGVTCDPALEAAVVGAVEATGRCHVLNGRFRGGWTTRHYGRPAEGFHAIQMELAMRGYLTEPVRLAPDNWPTPFDPATPLIDDLKTIIAACIAFASV
ncbi:N-formylglutamate deformylase [Sphingobium sp. BYY-5]|uniref:N-formylglutamate deformylase n=1 Tax=Sphingobium sp. BYY-5 TaxID=2926400 RepID=UPI001FA778D0|nr:N-formylglutamate deformylase [Sphingobium sp. BYY-5]MCI4591920.1 N-formylglutamate deformylase [Sphingobium sp. BYY-5]